MTHDNSENQLSHVNASGEANMVGVSAKAETHRKAICEGWVLFSGEALNAIRNDNVNKGDVVSTARIAGLMAVKKCAELIPLCHPLRISKAALDIQIMEADEAPESIRAASPDAKGAARLEATVEAVDRTGVEMEAMTAVSIGALTMYDMLKAVDKSLVATAMRLTFKSGGKSGEWKI